jgi:hypothetical protein
MYTEYEISLYLKDKEKIDRQRAARWRLLKGMKAGKPGRMTGMAQGFAARIAAMALKAGEHLQAAAEAERESHTTAQAA